MRRRAVLSLVLAGGCSVAAVMAGSQEPDTTHWPQFRGRHAAGVADGANLPDAWDAQRHERDPVEGAPPRARALEPRRVGRPGVRHDRDLVAGGRHVQAGPLRRGHRFRGRHRAQVAGAEPRQADRQGPVGAHRLHRGAEGEAAHQGHLRERDAGDRRALRGRLLRVAGPLRLRPGRQPQVEARPRAPRRRRLRRRELRVGHGQLADPLQGPGDRAVRPAEGLVPDRAAALRRRDRVEGLARRAAVLGDADRLPGQGRGAAASS